MKRLLFAVLPLMATVAIAQPPEPRQPPKPAAPLMTLEQANTVLGAPTRVTLHLKDATPQTVVAEFAKQAKVQIRMQAWSSAERNKPLTIDIDNQPFWVALREICAKLQVQPQPYGIDNAIMLSPTSAGFSRGAEIPLSPLLSLRLSQISHTRTLSLINDGGQIKATTDDRSMPIAATLLFDPKLAPMQNTMRLTVNEAVDEKGLSLVKENAYAYSSIPLMASLTIPLEWREDMGKKLTRLSAKVTCFVVAKREVWEVPNVLNAKDASKIVRGPDGDETYSLVSARQVGSQYQIQIKVARPQVLVQPEIAPEGRQLFYMRRELSRAARLLDGAGRAYRSMGGGGSQDLYTLTFGAPLGESEKLEAPQKLVLDIPTEFRQLEIPIDLKDIPLP